MISFCCLDMGFCNLLRATLDQRTGSCPIPFRGCVSCFIMALLSDCKSVLLSPCCERSAVGAFACDPMVYMKLYVDISGLWNDIKLEIVSLRLVTSHEMVQCYLAVCLSCCLYLCNKASQCI